MLNQAQKESYETILVICRAKLVEVHAQSGLLGGLGD